MGLIIISFIAFISLGLPDGLLGVAWPGIREYFDLPVDALGTVSYTHLRAHETLRYLVCRLLLEKKK